MVGGTGRLDHQAANQNTHSVVSFRKFVHYRTLRPHDGYWSLFFFCNDLQQKQFLSFTGLLEMIANQSGRWILHINP